MSRPADKQAVSNQHFRAAQIFKQRPASLEPLGLAKDLLRVCNGLFSEGFPTGVHGSFTRPHPTLRTSFPLPIPGRPNGHREASIASIQLSQDSTSSPYPQPALVLALAPCCSFSRKAMTGFNASAMPVGKRGILCGKHPPPAIFAIRRRNQQNLNLSLALLDNDSWRAETSAVSRLCRTPLFPVVVFEATQP